MAKQRATDTRVRSLKAKDSRYDVWFEGGLGIRVGTSGKRTWQTMIRQEIDAKVRQRRIFLGTYPKIGVAKANSLCASAREAVHKGENPAAVADGGAPRAPKHITDKFTVGILIDDYLRLYARPNKRSADQDEAFLDREIRPRWGKRLATDISRRDVIEVLDEIVTRGSPVSANRVLAVTRKMFNWAVGRDRLPSSPCVAIERPVKETERDRSLTPDEIKSFWNGLEDATIDTMLSFALKLLLVTGQRRTEVIGATWDEFDFKTRWWEIPAARTKAKRAHRVPLSDLALHLINDIWTEAGKPDSKYLFVNKKTGKPYSPYSVSQGMRKSLNVMKLSDSPATPHDLRRTFSTRLGELGISQTIKGKLLNHSPVGVTSRVYDKFEYTTEKTTAMNAWGDRLREIVSDTPLASNVVSLQSAG